MQNSAMLSLFKDLFKKWRYSAPRAAAAAELLKNVCLEGAVRLPEYGERSGDAAATEILAIAGVMLGFGKIRAERSAALRTVISRALLGVFLAEGTQRTLTLTDREEDGYGMRLTAGREGVVIRTIGYGKDDLAATIDWPTASLCQQAAAAYAGESEPQPWSLPLPPWKNGRRFTAAINRCSFSAAINHRQAASESWYSLEFVFEVAPEGAEESTLADMPAAESYAVRGLAPVRADAWLLADFLAATAARYADWSAETLAVDCC